MDNMTNEDVRFRPSTPFFGLVLDETCTKWRLPSCTEIFSLASKGILPKDTYFWTCDSYVASADDSYLPDTDSLHPNRVVLIRRDG
jgi:hypothetical protein